MGRFQLELIYLYRPSIQQFLFLSCRPFVVNTTFSTGLVDVEVTSVIQQLLDGRTVENKGKLILIQPINPINNFSILTPYCLYRIN